MVELHPQLMPLKTAVSPRAFAVFPSCILSHHSKYMLSEGIFKQAFCKLKSYVNEIRKSILSLQIIILLYFSVSQSQEMKQSRSFPRYYLKGLDIAFFPSVCQQNNQIKYKFVCLLHLLQWKNIIVGRSS